MSVHFAKRSHIVSTSQAFNQRAAELEAQGKKIIRMHLGAPSTGAPSKALAAVEKAENSNIMGYTSSLGIMPLRERIAKHYDDTYGVNIDPKRILITVGASGALILGALATCDVGDQFALPYPAYPAYKHTLHLLGIDTVGVSTDMNHHLQPTKKDIAALDKKPRAIIVASPSNPGGTLLSPEELKDLVTYCDQHKIQFFSDEIYHGITYDETIKAETALKYSDNVIVINSFSKYYSMPGWRLGWMVVPEDLVGPCAAIARNLLISPPTPSQYAAISAFDCLDELDHHVERYRANRDLMLKGMPEAGFDRFLKPQGAFYFYAHVEHLHHDSHQFALKMLEETGVVAMPGTDFDPHHGHHYMRFSYAGATEDVKEAIDRLQQWRR